MRILRRFLARVANFVTRREDDRRLRSLEDENSRLKRLVAGLSLDREMLKAVIAKKRPQLVDRRTEAQWLAWGAESQIELRHIQPGKPTQNAYLESFHGRLHEECLQVNWFTNLFSGTRQGHSVGERIQSGHSE